MRTAFAFVLALTASALGCTVQPSGAPVPAPSTAPTTRSLTSSSAAASASPPLAESAAAATAAAPSSTAPLADCSALGCRLFDTPADAFRAVLETKPLVLAIGEAHAQKGTEGIPSSAKRFTEELLPLLEGRGSDLLVELMAPPGGCKKVTAEVKTKQKVVTEKQAEGDQNEYVVMGNEAKKRGVVPDLLRPSCADLDAIDKAGEGAIGASLSTIARLTKAKVSELLSRNARVGRDKIIVTYGGAMHNDRTPPPERAEWSFGADLAAQTKGRYVELDLFVPEFIQDTETWKKLEWYPYFDPARHPDKTTLFNPRPGSYVMIFPRAAR